MGHQPCGKEKSKNSHNLAQRDHRFIFILACQIYLISVNTYKSSDTSHLRGVPRDRHKAAADMTTHKSEGLITVTIPLQFKYMPCLTLMTQMLFYGSDKNWIVLSR